VLPPFFSFELLLLTAFSKFLQFFLASGI